MKKVFAQIYFWSVLILIFCLFLLIGHVDFDNKGQKESNIHPITKDGDSIVLKNSDTSRVKLSYDFTKLNNMLLSKIENPK